MGWIGYVRCEKSRRDFVSRTFVLTAPVQYVLHQVSCSYETIPNAPKYYETDRNISFGSNGVHRLRPLLKIPMWLRGTNFCINCTSSVCFAPSFMLLETIPNAPKYYETYRNITLGSNWVDWDCPLQKIPTSLRGTNFCINCTSSPRFAPSFMQLRNNPKCTKILQRSNGVDWVRSLEKIPTSLRGTNFSINCTNSPYFAPSFMQLRNDPKCTQTLWNTPKHEFRIQWGGSGAFVGKNYNVTSWHELLH